jgi:transcriptional regulator with XRE-family HTH domain
MSDTLGRRIFLAHLELSYRLGRKVTLAEFGEMIAKRMGRDTAFTAAAVSRWESGTQVPTPQIIEAIALITHTDPGWISHGKRSAAPRPGRIENPGTGASRGTDAHVPASTHRKTPVNRRRS